MVFSKWFRCGKKSIKAKKQEDAHSETQNSQSAIPNEEPVEKHSDEMEINKEVAMNWKPAEEHLTLPDATYDHHRRFHAVKESPYVLPADISEQERLFLQHRLITYGFGRLFHMPIEEHLKTGNIKVLDCGCGPGAWALQVAKKYPNATVVGLDMARTVLDDTQWSNGNNISFVLGNVLEGLPFEDNTFDAVYQRFLVVGIPRNKWVDVIKELKRVTKPGGYIELVENKFGFINAGPNFQKLHIPLQESMIARGVDIDAGQNLKGYMEEAGLEILELAMHSVPSGWGGRFGELQDINSKSVWSGLKPYLTKVLSLSDIEYDELVEKAQEDCAEYKSFYNVYSVTGRVVK